MRKLIFSTLALAFQSASVNSLQAAEPAACRDCREQQKVCVKNYSAKTCKTEFDICMKSCKPKMKYNLRGLPPLLEERA
jgi:hypothetical protein